MIDFPDLVLFSSRLRSAIREELISRGMQVELICSLWFDDLTVTKIDETGGNITIFASVGTEVKCRTIETKYFPDVEKAASSLIPNCSAVKISVAGEENYSSDESEEKDENSNAAEIHEGVLSILSRQVSKNAGFTQSVPHVTASDAVDLNTAPPLRKSFTFDTFVVGSTNEFAYKAATTVAEFPASRFNPFFIYGSSGLGKTHLLHAIANDFLRRYPGSRVVYVTGEDFTNQLVESMPSNASKGSPKFRSKFRTCDLLLVDDVQFIAGKVYTQEEFFHTFNALYEAGKQVCLTSDRPPKDIKNLEVRLTSRFESGLTVDIQPPDLELRAAILGQKASALGVELPPDILMFLAENITQNIRQIEGAIKKLNAYAHLTKSGISMELAKSSLADILSGGEPVNLTVEKIISAAGASFGVSPQDIKGRKRTKEIAAARHAAIYVIRKLTPLSLPSIGKLFDRDHTTVMSSITAVEAEISLHPETIAKYDEIARIAGN
ncbi:hypothetical protein FACS1894219_05930 [Clostridia bacterium]|nr:hypothetical protein FACS1894219_05930 [Clostridia bacterium]